MRTFNKATDSLDYVFDYNPVETSALREKTYENLSVEDLQRIALWKLDRVVEVPESLLQKLRELSTQERLSARSPEAVQALEQLVACPGISYPMASAFLKFIRPTVFPIIDVRAYRALTGRRLRYHQYTTEVYLQYVDKVAEIASSREVPLHIVDEQLYCYDKANNGKIDA
jgi:thermostable 8-oxoguanine DNA glycosylase